jgi:hypothetical protein
MFHGILVGVGSGGIRPDRDVEAMAEAWGRIARRYSTVKFVVFGHRTDLFWEQLPADRIVVIPWVDVREYPAGLHNIDIGCAAVSDSEFNRCKSPIKAMEYAASGAAVVASPTVYGQLIEHGVDGYIANTVEEWELYLSELVEDYTHRHQLSKALLAKGYAVFALDAQGHGDRIAENDYQVVNLYTEPGAPPRKNYFTLREVISIYAGGMKADANFKLAQTGGSSGSIVPASLQDTPMDFESFRKAGVSLGSGGLSAWSSQNLIPVVLIGSALIAAVLIFKK